MQPSISVVIPTHNRSTVVRRTLMSLAHQTVPAEQFEVILVADGCEDDTAAMAQVLEVPYRLTILAQGASGAAAARNLGAGAAAAALLMFLDDDMEALPGLIEAHLAAHHERPDTVVLGYFPVVPTEGPSDFYRVTSRAWWEDMFTRQARPNYRFTFRDLCAGNISLSREQFFNAGGFDPQFKGMSGEDYELGVRLLRAGARFSFVRAATSLHHDASTQARSCQRALADGRGQVVLLRKHPELVTELSLGFPVTKPFQLLIYQLVWRAPAPAALLARLLALVLDLANALKLFGLWQRAYGYLHGYYYWSGVRAETGSQAALSRLVRAAKAYKPGYREYKLDLATSLGDLEALLEQHPADGLSLSYGTTAIGKIAARPGTERLRAVHVRDVLIHSYSIPLLGAVVMAQAAQESLHRPHSRAAAAETRAPIAMAKEAMG